MAESILTYTPGVDRRSSGTRANRAGALMRLADTVGVAMHNNDMAAIRESQKAAEADILQNAIDPMREKNDAAYAGAVLRNKLYETSNGLLAELQNPASKHSNMKPDEYTEMLRKEAEAFYTENATSPHADTNAEIFSRVSLQAQRGLVATQAKVYKDNVKMRRAVEATSALSKLPPGDEVDFTANTTELITTMLPDTEYTFKEQLQAIMGAAYAAADNGDPRLLEYAKTNLDAAVHMPQQVTQAEKAHLEWTRREQDNYFADLYAKNETAAINGAYTTWEADIRDSEKVRRWTRSQINSWRAESHRDRVKTLSIDDYKNKFNSLTSMAGASNEVQQEVFSLALREAMSQVKPDDVAGKVQAMTEFAAKLAGQSTIFKELRDNMDAYLARPVFTKEAFAQEGFQDAAVIFKTLKAVMAPDQLLEQVGKEAYDNGMLVEQALKDANGDPEQAAAIYIMTQNEIKNRPPLSFKHRMDDRDVDASVEMILSGSLPGHDPAVKRVWAIGSEAENAIHTTAIEYELQREYGLARKQGLSQEAAMESARTKVAAGAQYFGNEMVWTSGASMNGFLNMPPGSGYKDRDKAWEHFCAKYGLDSDKVHFKMSGQYGYITDDTGQALLPEGIIPLAVIGGDYKIALEEERQIRLSRNARTKALDVADNNRALELELNEQYGDTNDAAAFMSDGTTLGTYRYATEDERLRMRNMYRDEQRQFFKNLIRPFVEAKRKLESGVYQNDEMAERFLSFGLQYTEPEFEGTQEETAAWQEVRQNARTERKGRKMPENPKLLPVRGAEKTSPEFRSKVVDIATDLDINPNHLMAVMSFESGGSFSPSKKNPVSSATGLIQFMSKTAKGLGTTTKELAAMSAEDQLDYVKKYLAPYEGRLKSVQDVYMAVLWPKAIGKDADYVLWRKGSRQYEANKGLDKTKDGTITAGEAASRVTDVMRRAEKG